jgi:hypothetical protein
MSERIRVVWARPDNDIEELKGAGPVGERVMAYLVDVERALGEARGLVQTLKVDNDRYSMELAQAHRLRTVDEIGDRVKVTAEGVRHALGEVARVFVEAGLLTQLPELPEDKPQLDNDGYHAVLPALSPLARLYNEIEHLEQAIDMGHVRDVGRGTTSALRDIARELSDLRSPMRQWVAAVEIGPNIELFEVTAADEDDATAQVWGLIGDENYARAGRITVNRLPLERKT